MTSPRSSESRIATWVGETNRSEMMTSFEVCASDGRGERADASAVAHPAAAIEHFDEDYSFHSIVSMYHRTNASALS